MTELEKIERRIDTLVESMWHWQSELDACQDDRKRARMLEKIDKLEQKIDDLQLQAEYL